MCETRWQNRKDLTWSGCSGEQGMPAEATECNQTTTKCKNHGRTCDATAHQMAAMRRRPTLKAARFLQVVRQKRWNFHHTSCTFHSLD